MEQLPDEVFPCRGFPLGKDLPDGECPYAEFLLDGGITCDILLLFLCERGFPFEKFDLPGGGFPFVRLNLPGGGFPIEGFPPDEGFVFVELEVPTELSGEIPC